MTYKFTFIISTPQDVILYPEKLADQMIEQIPNECKLEEALIETQKERGL